MQHKRLAALALLLAAALLGGCGDVDSDGGANPAADSIETSEQAQSQSQPPPTGDESIRNFGDEAAGAEREAIVSAEQRYLRALVRGDHAAACSLLAKRVHESLAQLAGGGGGCPALLPKLLSPSAPAVARQQAEGEITGVRVEGEQVFVLFHAPGAKLYMLVMVREDDQWKAANLASSVVVPSL